uniref:Putative glycosyltransferase family 25 protein n=1 Tax=Magnetococcus massalia (strain MO-1) TaxID=451514 RepID=A0A1S7LHC2_MAGMO|nr:putative glycosyltransferase family 25 protein [Candidatus Magnetococcus massalia]
MIDQIMHYWINRDSDVIRRRHMEQLFSLSNIPNERFRAVTPETLPNITIDKRYQSSNNIIEIAVIASHLHAIYKAYYNGYDHVVILEDDISSNYIYDLNMITRSAPRGWKILQLHTHNTSLIDRYASLHFQLAIHWHNFDPNSWSSGAYLINREGMKQVLDALDVTERLGERSFNLSNVHYFNKIVSDFVIFNSAPTYTCTLQLFTSIASLDIVVMRKGNDNRKQRRIQAEKLIQAYQMKAEEHYNTLKKSHITREIPFPFAIHKLSTDVVNLRFNSA